jgi:hypothetical protein
MKSIMKELDLIVYPTGRKPHATRMGLYFDNASFDNTRTAA